jgi:exosortase K
MKRTLGILLLVALAMWGMKRYYAEAPVDELQWILGPTATLVTALTSVPFEWEPGQGYLSRERFFLIAKACAGINFMIAAFGMVAAVRGRRVRSCRAAAAFCCCASSRAIQPRCASMRHASRRRCGWPPTRLDSPE